VRFLWRFDFKRLRRLCLFILRRRFFLRLPMGGEKKLRELGVEGLGNAAAGIVSRQKQPVPTFE
jgi:hypothetical protein